MSGQQLEQARALHEDLEILERAMYRELGDPNNQRLKRVDTIARDQVVSTLLDAHTERATRLASIYQDKDGARREEILSMSGSGVFNSFYGQLNQLRSYHRKHALPAATEPYEKDLLTDVLQSAPEASFTGEEAEVHHMREAAALWDSYLLLTCTSVDATPAQAVAGGLLARLHTCTPVGTPLAQATARGPVRTYLPSLTKGCAILAPLTHEVGDGCTRFQYIWAGVNEPV